MTELADARVQTDRLFDLISPEALFSRPISERHRLIFYLGHFDAFDWNLLARRTLNAPAFHSVFDALFERGIDPPPGEVPSDTANDWPGRQEVEKYIFTTRDWIDAHLSSMDATVVRMAIEHRLMHAETFAYLMHNLPYSDKTGEPQPESSVRPAPANPMVRISSGNVEMGRRPGEGFGWDNEYLAHETAVRDFAIMKYKVSNGEYLEFVREGGQPSHFWRCEAGRWFYRGMFGEIPLPLDHPVWGTWRQADEYAKWRALALPTEAQFYMAARIAPGNADRDNFDFRHWDPIAVDASNVLSGPAQMVGNGWEWTQDIFAPFEGFAAHPGYPGYSADFFDGGHYVLKGASPRTASALTRLSFRNWFRPEYPHMYAGFRLVEN